MTSVVSRSGTDGWRFMIASPSWIGLELLTIKFFDSCLFASTVEQLRCQSGQGCGLTLSTRGNQRLLVCSAGLSATRNGRAIVSNRISMTLFLDKRANGRRLDGG